MNVDQHARSIVRGCACFRFEDFRINPADRLWCEGHWKQTAQSLVGREVAVGLCLTLAHRSHRDPAFFCRFRAKPLQIEFFLREVYLFTQGGTGFIAREWW